MEIPVPSYMRMCILYMAEMVTISDKIVHVFILVPRSISCSNYPRSFYKYYVLFIRSCTMNLFFLKLSLHFYKWWSAKHEYKDNVLHDLWR